ncbi:hypothetical protein KA005_60115 [bacterium]|nr:hypothetical protein [bacterium]
MNPQDRAYKRLMKDSREYLSDIIKKYSKAKTGKEKALRVLHTYQHFFKVAARLCALHEDFTRGKFEEGR